MSTAGGREKTPRDLIWDILASHFGDPRTKTERNQFGKVVGELLEAGANEEETENACSYVIRNFDSPSVFAVVKWFSVAQNDKPKPSKQEEEINRLRSVQ
jgi:hypothetical protein